MKIGKLIEGLNQLQKEHGDVDVVFPDISNACEPTEIAGCSTIFGDDDKAVHVMLCDTDTLDAFSSES